MGAKPHSDRVTIRLPEALARAATKAAQEAGVSVGEWLRRLAETATGVAAEVRQGFAAGGPRRRKAQAKAAARARWKRKD